MPYWPCSRFACWGTYFLAGARSNFMITMGVFGALVLRALSDDPQPMVLTMLGVVLAGLALALNHHIINWDSDWWFVVSLLVALLYALWKKIVYWFSI